MQGTKINKAITGRNTGVSFFVSLFLFLLYCFWPKGGFTIPLGKGRSSCAAKNGGREQLDTDWHLGKAMRYHTYC